MFALMLRLGFSLAIVIGVMILIAGFMKKRGIVVGGASSGRRSGAPVSIDVLGRRHLGRQAQVAVVRTEGRLLVLGVTDHQVTILTEVPADENDDHTRAGRHDIEVLELTSTAAANPGSPRTGSSTAAPSRPGPAWKTMLDSMRDRTVRR